MTIMSGLYVLQLPIKNKRLRYRIRTSEHIFRAAAIGRHVDQIVHYHFMDHGSALRVQAAVRYDLWTKESKPSFLPCEIHINTTLEEIIGLINHYYILDAKQVLRRHYRGLNKRIITIA